MAIEQIDAAWRGYVAKCEQMIKKRTENSGTITLVVTSDNTNGVVDMATHNLNLTDICYAIVFLSTTLAERCADPRVQELNRHVHRLLGNTVDTASGLQ